MSGPRGRARERRHRVTFGRCGSGSSRVDSRTNPDGHRDQDVYLKALTAHGAVDHVEYGAFVARVRTAPLATLDEKGRPVVTTSRWPVMVQDAAGVDVPDARFVAQVLNVEEKGSDAGWSRWGR